MLCKGDSIGVFQVESRAQINMLPRLKPRKLYDLVVQVAIVRPGPIEGDMVHPYLRRRAGKEAVEFPSPDPPHARPTNCAQLLGETYGVPLFQEQAMKLAIVAAEFTPDEANQLRRAMATFRNVGGMDNFEAKLVERHGRGAAMSADFAAALLQADRGVRQLWLSRKPCAVVRAAGLCLVVDQMLPPRGVRLRAAQFAADGLLRARAAGPRRASSTASRCAPIDVNASGWDNQPGAGRRRQPRRSRLRLSPDRRVSRGHGRPRWSRRAAHAPFASIEDARRAAPACRRARCACSPMPMRSARSRRTGAQALWEVRRTPPRQLPLFAAADAPELGEEPDAQLPAMPLSEQVAADYQTTRLSLKDHPMALPARRCSRAKACCRAPRPPRRKDGARARVAGVVLVRQRPGKGNAIFVTIEDETGITNVLMWARDFERNRRAVMASRLMVLEGVIQRSEEGVVHLMTNARPRPQRRTARGCRRIIVTDPPLARGRRGDARRATAIRRRPAIRAPRRASARRPRSCPSRGTFINRVARPQIGRHEPNRSKHLATLGMSPAEKDAVETFRRDVVEPSMTQLVIIDFWAEWCGPCKALTPTLEKVAADYADKGVVLAKVDTDKNQFIAAQFQIKSIPTVYAMFQGQLVADLTSARTESQLRVIARPVAEAAADPVARPRVPRPSWSR